MKSGYFFVHKPSGITSSHLVLNLKKRFRLQSIGHTGTLDRFAEGLMILPFGDFTSFSQLFLGSDKSYYAEVSIGKRTDSGDVDGLTTEEWSEIELKAWLAKCPHWKETWRKHLLGMKEWKVQTAPTISALKVSGKRQSDHVREGLEVEAKVRPMEIFRIWDLQDTEFGFSFRIHVSSGTYIRKIVLDLSDLMGIPLVLKRLVREQIGSWKAETASPLETLQLDEAKPWQEVLVLPSRRLTSLERKAVVHGGYVWDHLPNADERGFYFLEPDSEEIVAWCLYQGKRDHLPYRYGKVFFDPSAKIMFSN
ncbi:tRNA pseudouridine synthase B [Leptospira ryugenii]|uniref:tRNA pseudouridine(55) synthase n=1 Tax=Leptospira ryugenii TaxID=1917863 RepID=A0A2P2DXD2_9LEPT|nr:tRNA pseudouridine(55) synthase TruB [Leptospira ryugenii]GBF49291.1 tRNA pseudouridine synthase B [Leptospira ryugenii]